MEPAPTGRAALRAGDIRSVQTSPSEGIPRQRGVWPMRPGLRLRDGEGPMAPARRGAPGTHLDLDPQRGDADRPRPSDWPPHPGGLDEADGFPRLVSRSVPRLSRAGVLPRGHSSPVRRQAIRTPSPQGQGHPRPGRRSDRLAGLSPSGLIPKRIHARPGLPPGSPGRFFGNVASTGTGTAFVVVPWSRNEATATMRGVHSRTRRHAFASRVQPRVSQRSASFLTSAM